MLSDYVFKCFKLKFPSVQYRRIKNYISSRDKNFNIYAYKSVDSTNDEAKKIFKKDNFKKFCVLAEKQLKGRGRGEKTFYSPLSGIYLSIVLPFNKNISEDILTCAAAVGVALAVEIKTGEQPKIKWVNDLLLSDKKFCGILCEKVMDKNGKSGVIIGIGINCNNKTEAFPEELKNIAGFLQLEISKSEFVAEILKQVENSVSKDKNEIINEYKKRSIMLDKIITYNFNNETFSAKVTDIDELGRLKVKDKNGKTIFLSSGEISVKGLY